MKTTVALHGVVATDGTKSFRHRTVVCTMDPDEILTAVTLDDAISAFVRNVSYLDQVHTFMRFTINGKTYTEEYWTKP